MAFFTSPRAAQPRRPALLHLLLRQFLHHAAGCSARANTGTRVGIGQRQGLHEIQRLAKPVRLAGCRSGCPAPLPNSAVRQLAHEIQQRLAGMSSSHAAQHARAAAFGTEQRGCGVTRRLSASTSKALAKLPRLQ